MLLRCSDLLFLLSYFIFLMFFVPHFYLHNPYNYHHHNHHNYIKSHSYHHHPNHKNHHNYHHNYINPHSYHNCNLSSYTVSHFINLPYHSHLPPYLPKPPTTITLL